jgi:hypothetical protein
MSIDTAFQPKFPTVVVATAAIQVIPQGTASGMLSFRICNLATAAQRLGWGPTAAGTSATGPSGAGTANATYSINIATGAVITLELPATTFFIGQNAAATGFEITPGQGYTTT